MDTHDRDPFATLRGMATEMMEAWQQAASGAGRPAAGHDPADLFRQGMAFWGQLAGQGAGGRPQDVMGEAVEKLTAATGPWLGMMQSLVAQFTDGKAPASATDIARAWQRMVEASGGNPLADALKGMAGTGGRDWTRWLEDAGPLMAMFTQNTPDWTRQPAFGFAREHQERWQRLARAVEDYRRAQQAHDALLLEALRDAFPLFEEKLAERSEPGRQIDSVRGLFDVWVDAAEEAYARMALSTAFQKAFGGMVNAQMRLRLCLQGEVEQMARALGMPTRSDVESGHRRLHALERELRRLKARLAEGGAAAGAAAPKPPANGGGAAKPARKRAAKKAARTAAATKQAAPKKPVAKKAAKKAAGTKTATKKQAHRKAPAKKAAARRKEA